MFPKNSGIFLGGVRIRKIPVIGVSILGVGFFGKLRRFKAKYVVLVTQL